MCYPQNLEGVNAKAHIRMHRRNVVLTGQRRPISGLREECNWRSLAIIQNNQR